MSDNSEYLEHQPKSVLKSRETFANDRIWPVNVAKTKATIIHSAAAVSKPRVEYKGMLIEYVESYKFLRVETGTKLGEDNFVNNRLNKIRNIYNELRK